MTEPSDRLKSESFKAVLKTSVKQPDRRGGGREKKSVWKEKKRVRDAACRGCSACHMLPIRRLKQSILLNIRFTLWLATPRCPLAVSGPNLLNQLAHHRAAANKIKPTCTTQNKSMAICWSLIQPRRWQRTSERSAARWEINQRTTTRHRPTSVHTFSDAWPKQISEFRPISSRSFQENMQHLKHIKYIKGHLK